MTADPTPTSIIASLRARLDAVSDLADHLAGNEAAPLIREALNGYVPTGDLDPTPATGADQGGALTEAEREALDFAIAGRAGCPTVAISAVVERIKADAVAAARADERARIAQAIEADSPEGYFDGDVAEGYVIAQGFAARIAREGGQR